ncbi:uncharacterized protein, partial [Solanum tuberosum]|uniref:uncharacterized protein n=1 Tax=Solanum tuberosum TaxID=4113 RepID=UPI00073A2EE3
SLLVHEQKINLQDKDEVALKSVLSSKGTERKRDEISRKLNAINVTDFGHYQPECRTNLNRNRGRRSNFVETKEDREIKEEEEEEEVSLLMAYTSNGKVSAHLWYLDTGCTNHMCGQKEAFSELDESFQDTVRFGNNSVVSSKGKVKKMHGINLNFASLKFLKQKELVLGLPKLESPNAVCEDCVVSKQHREPFSASKSWRVNKVLELIHSDICGPISPTSNRGKRYFISFIDDYSKNTWVCFCKEKFEALETFKKFKVLAQVKCLRTNRRGEYNSQEYVEFCEKHGIKWQLTTTYTP